MYKLGLSSRNAKFILLRSRKRKMTAGSGFGESTLEEIACFSAALLVGLRNVLSALGRGAPSNADANLNRHALRPNKQYWNMM